MKHYIVVFSENAVSDLSSSIQWGIETWGEELAQEWYSEIKTSILKLLGQFPLSQPIAPDNHEYNVEVRQMVVGRYRVLFTIKGRKVVILHIRGPHH